MALRLARLPIITEPVSDLETVIDSINIRIDEINRILYEIELENARGRGDDRNIPQFNNNLNLNNFRLTNVARSKEPGDAVTRRELEEKGILGNRADGIHLKGDLTVDGSLILTSSGSGGADEATTNSDVDTAIEESLEANVATSRDGDIFNREQAIGTNGNTDGTVSMGVDGLGKTRPIEVRDGELTVQDHEVRTILLLILEELERMNNAD